MKGVGTDIGTIHFVGIGGIGMSGIAEVMNNLGYAVQGSDIAEGYVVEGLRKRGIKVMIGHSASGLDPQATRRSTTTADIVPKATTTAAVSRDTTRVGHQAWKRRSLRALASALRRRSRSLPSARSCSFFASW